MTGKEFLKNLSHSKVDVLQTFLDLLSREKIDNCLIGGLAVNVYAEPVVSMDLDLVVVFETLKRIKREAPRLGFSIEKFKHSINLAHPQSELRIQLQTDKRYQPFIARSSMHEVLGYQLRVAALEDVIQGKVWAYLDCKRRSSKRQKDLADIMRLVESKPEIKKILPPDIRKKIA